jgi:hypothetical protein
VGIQAEIWVEVRVEIDPDDALLRWQAPAEQVTTPRRFQDAGSDLWRTLNVTQENLINGGLNGRTRKDKPTRTRAVGSIDEGTRINRALWMLAESMRALKTGAPMPVAAPEDAVIIGH